MDYQAYREEWIREHLRERGMKLLDGIKYVVAVSSGKGGVGKSTVAVNLALGLKELGYSVGILDADIYGPSVGKMLGLVDHPGVSEDGQKLMPIEVYGIKAMSMGLMVGEDTTMSWRGPMLTLMLQQLIHGTEWGELDYLVVDMPPGTGDVPITMASRIPLTGVVVVTTPQDVALIDVLKGISMFKEQNVPVWGVVENMSVHVCEGCGREDHIFGTGASEKLKNEYGVETLGFIPLDGRICSGMDSGHPVVLESGGGLYRDRYLSICQRVVESSPIRVLEPYYQEMLGDMDKIHAEGQAHMQESEDLIEESEDVEGQSS